MAQALARVKRELGTDAVVLHTRSYKRGGLFGIGSRMVIEVTAADGKQVGQINRQKARRSPRRQAIDAAASRRKSPSRPPVISLPPSPPPMPPIQADEQMAAGDLIKRTYAAAKVELEKSTPTATIAPMPADHQKLADEMKSVKRMVARMLHQQKKVLPPLAAPAKDACETSGGMSDALFDQYRVLLEQEVAEEIADEVVASVRERLSSEQLEDTEACRSAVLKAVAALLPTPTAVSETNDVDSPSKQTSRRPRTLAFVGPTGVGKTTTIAKLAANFKLKENKRVALVTLDTYRIAAVEQLRTYAHIIGIPLRVVSSACELVDVIATMSDCDVVLIDTAGRSQRNGQRLDELGHILKTANPDEVHMVLSSTCTQSVLLDVVERFSMIRTDRVIFTKLDEAVTFGVLVNVLKKVGKQLSYVTTGQEVPHQIEPGCHKHVAALVLGEGEVAG